MICDGCKVNPIFEHRCHKDGCACEESTCKDDWKCLPGAWKPRPGLRRVDQARCPKCGVFGEEIYVFGVVQGYAHHWALKVHKEKSKTT